MDSVNYSSLREIKVEGEYYYSVYGKVLKAPFELEGFRPAKSTNAFITLTLSSLQFMDSVRPLAENTQDWFHYSRLADGSIYMCWTNIFEFLVSADGKLVHCCPLSRATRESFLTYVLNQVLSFSFLLQDTESIHATVLKVASKAFALVGDCGYGKSTLAAALLGRGAQLVTDDLMVTHFNHENLALVYPGLPRIKLYPLAKNRVFWQAPQGTYLNSDTRKLIIPVDKNLIAGDSCELKRIYVLNNPKVNPSLNIKLATIPPRLAFFELIKNTFNTIDVRPQRLKSQFEFTQQLVRSVEVKAFSYPRSWNSLNEVCHTVLTDFKK